MNSALGCTKFPFRSEPVAAHNPPCWPTGTRLLVGLVTLPASLALLVLGATELNIGFQGSRPAFAVALGCFLLALVAGRLLVSAVRGSGVPPADPRRRRRAARLALGWALLVQSYMLYSLPLHTPTAEEWGSLVTLAVLIVLTAFGGLQLRRAPRAALLALGLAAAYSSVMMARFVWVMSQWSGMYAGPAVTLSYLVALSMAAALILAVLTAWPLRRPAFVPRAT